MKSQRKRNYEFAVESVRKGCGALFDDFVLVRVCSGKAHGRPYCVWQVVTESDCVEIMVSGNSKHLRIFRSNPKRNVLLEKEMKS